MPSSSLRLEVRASAGVSDSAWYISPSIAMNFACATFTHVMLPPAGTIIYLWGTKFYIDTNLEKPYDLRRHL